MVLQNVSITIRVFLKHLTVPIRLFEEAKLQIVYSVETLDCCKREHTLSLGVHLR